ncbi:pleckstrin homology domain-containing family H member 3 isoform X2 [Ambystoma mexicanum]|uniref:pleckstrin homology domain-containing family H member 3 isoform X2 n=1 Tax=Ambystoma mexicanum TaxID=8296 RepID=UPI0037E77C83
MPFQGLCWLVCCRHGFTLLRRDYGEKEEEEESFELQMSPDAQGTLDVCLSQPTRASNGPERLLQVSEEMRSLIAEKSKGKIEDEQDVIVKGWLQREVKGGVKTPWIRLRSYWFVLTQDSLDYYTSSEKNAKQLGTLVLTSLCSVRWPDKQSYKETGYWNVTVFGRKHLYQLYTEHLNEAVHWVCAIQKVIDSKAPLETPTQLLMKDLEAHCSSLEIVEQIYKHNPILRHTASPLYASLLPFSYGTKVDQSNDLRGYTSLPEEALKIFNSLQQLEGEADPVPLMQGILQTCLDLELLRDEVYCQLVKQTTGSPAPGQPADLCYWQLLTCMSCTFLPTSTVLRFLRFHLKRTREKFPDTEMDRYCIFISDSLEKTKVRECVPSWEEISVLMHRQPIPCTVHYPGAGSCKITINSHTTAEEVVVMMLDELSLGHSRNIFALYEQNNHCERAVGKTTIVADILTRFEKHAGVEKNVDDPRRLVFKLYCFLDMDSVPKDGVEFAILFEQAHEMVVQGYMATSEDTLQSLAALRLQFLNSDFSTHSPFPKLEELFPMLVLRARVLAASKPALSSKCPSMNFRAGLFSGALPNGLWNNSLVKQKAEEDLKFKGRLNEEGASVMSAIVDKWKVLQGMDKQEAMVAYVAIVKELPGFGSTLFDVDFFMSSTGSFSQKLWLGVSSQALSLYKQGDVEPFDRYCYTQISSFGVSDKSTFKVSVGDKDLIFETSKVDEISRLINTYLTSIGNDQSQQLEDAGSIPEERREPEPPAVQV